MTALRAIVAVAAIGISLFIIFFTNLPRSLNTALSGTSPQHVTITPDGRYVYISNSGTFTNNSVSVVDAGTNAVIVDIPAEIYPNDVAVSPDGRRAYVTSDFHGVLVIDTATNAIAATIPTRTRTRNLAVSPDGRHAYVTSLSNFPTVFDRGPEGVLVIDTATNTIAATIPMTRPDDVAVSPDGRHAYVTSNNDSDGRDVNGSVWVIDTATKTITTNILVGIHPNGVVVSPDGRYVYVANSGGIDPFGNPIKFDTNGGVSVIDTTINAINFYNNGGVSVIDTATNAITATIPTGASSSDLAVSPDGRHAYVTNNGGVVNPVLMISFPGSVSVIDTGTRTVDTTFGVDGDFPSDVVVSPDGRRIYVVVGDSVSVIDSTTNMTIASVSSGHKGLSRFFPVGIQSGPVPTRSSPPKPIEPPTRTDRPPGPTMKDPEHRPSSQSREPPLPTQPSNRPN